MDGSSPYNNHNINNNNNNNNKQQRQRQRKATKRNGMKAATTTASASAEVAAKWQREREYSFEVTDEEKTPPDKRELTPEQVVDYYKMAAGFWPEVFPKTGNTYSPTSPLYNKRYDGKVPILPNMSRPCIQRRLDFRDQCRGSKRLELDVNINKSNSTVVSGKWTSNAASSAAANAVASWINATFTNTWRRFVGRSGGGGGGGGGGDLRYRGMADYFGRGTEDFSRIRDFRDGHYKETTWRSTKWIRRKINVDNPTGKKLTMASVLLLLLLSPLIWYACGFENPATPCLEMLKDICDCVFQSVGTVLVSVVTVWKIPREGTTRIRTEGLEKVYAELKELRQAVDEAALGKDEELRKFRVEMKDFTSEELNKLWAALKGVDDGAGVEYEKLRVEILDRMARLEAGQKELWKRLEGDRERRERSVETLVVAIVARIFGNEGGGGSASEEDLKAEFAALRSEWKMLKEAYDEERTAKRKGLSEEASRTYLREFSDRVLREGTKAAAATTTTTTTSNVPPDLESYVKALIREALDVYDADKTALPDFALESAGGTVLSIRCTETILSDARYSVFGLPLLWWHRSGLGPRTVIQPGVHAGECWAFKGSTGSLVLQLSRSIYPTAFTMEHLPKSLAPDGKIDSAPREFSVWGLRWEMDENAVFLGEFEYSDDDDANSVQTFEAVWTGIAFPAVELKIHSNHGKAEYTCLYRFRVHGKLFRV